MQIMFQLPFHTGPEGRTKTYLFATLVPSNLSARVEPRKSLSLCTKKTMLVTSTIQFSPLPFDLF